MSEGFPRGRLVGWAMLVGVLVTVAYTAQLSAPDDRPDDLLYRSSTAIFGAIQYAIVLTAALLIARGTGLRATFALRRPPSVPVAAGLVLGAFLLVLAVGAVLELFLDAGEEQGLVPDAWDPERAGAFAANFVVVALVAPVVEELVFRGLGFTAVGSVFGPVVAILVTGIAFGLAHGLLEALPILALFGIVLGWLRHRTGSVYPAMALHAIFNGVALIAAVTT